MIKQGMLKTTGMEKHTMSTTFRMSILLAAFAVACVTARAQTVINGGFESASTNLHVDGTTTNVQALGWNQFGPGFRVSTNAPGDANNTGDPVTAHTGAYSLKCFSPGGWGGGGAYQNITNGFAAGQVLVISGYVLNWAGDPLTNLTPTAQQYGAIQMNFKDANTNALGGVSTPAYAPTSLPVNVWISGSATGTVPVGTALIQVYALSYGFGAIGGSYFFDDISIANLNVPIVTNFLHESIIGGLQVCWATQTSAVYQAQSSPDSNTWSSVGSLIAGDGNTNCAFDAAGEYNNHKFYRVLEMK